MERNLTAGELSLEYRRQLTAAIDIYCACKDRAPFQAFPVQENRCRALGALSEVWRMVANRLEEMKQRRIK